jgi:hypothetical protein
LRTISSQTSEIFQTGSELQDLISNCTTGEEQSSKWLKQGGPVNYFYGNQDEWHAVKRNAYFATS